MTHRHITNAQDLDWAAWQNGSRFEGKCKQLGTAANAKNLGCSLIKVSPGKSAWPAHYHLANEEAIYILRGTGTMRLGETHQEVRPGSYIAMLADPNQAHQLTNTGEEELEYLCFSTMVHPEVVGYPDSQKIGILCGSAPGGSQEERKLTAFFPESAHVDYWQGET